MADAEVVRVAREFSDALAKHELRQMQAMTTRYVRLRDRLSGAIDALTLELDGMRARGEALPMARVERLERYRHLQTQIAVELETFVKYAAGQISAEQADAGAAGVRSAADKLKATGAVSVGAEVAFDQLATTAVEAMVGMTADGAPLTRLLSEAYGDVSAAIAAELADAVAQGVNPRQTARRLRDALGVGLDRILLIARTEQLRAFRTGEQNRWSHDDVVERYQRLARKDVRTCIACLAMDGELFPMTEPFADHPNGRCAMLPVPYGFDGFEFERGSEWFAKLDEDTQRRIAGPTRTELFRDGKISVRDMATRRTHTIWGDSWQPTTVLELKAQADAAGIGTAAPLPPAPAPPVATGAATSTAEAIVDTPEAQRRQIWKVTEEAVADITAKVDALQTPAQLRRFLRDELGIDRKIALSTTIQFDRLRAIVRALAQEHTRSKIRVHTFQSCRGRALARGGSGYLEFNWSQMRTLSAPSMKRAADEADHLRARLAEHVERHTADVRGLFDAGGALGEFEAVMAKHGGDLGMALPSLRAAARRHGWHTHESGRWFVYEYALDPKGVNVIATKKMREALDKLESGATGAEYVLPHNAEHWQAVFTPVPGIDDPVARRIWGVVTHEMAHNHFFEHLSGADQFEYAKLFDADKKAGTLRKPSQYGVTGSKKSHPSVEHYAETYQLWRAWQLTGDDRYRELIADWAIPFFERASGLMGAAP